MKGNYLIIKLFILLMLAPQSGFTQYKSFFGKEEIWGTRNLIFLADEPRDLDFFYSNVRDSAEWNGKTYHKIVHRLKKTDKPFYTLYAREVLDSGRMYLYDTAAGMEFLYIDMSLNVGDTFKTNIDHDEPIIVKKVYYDQGLKHLELKSNSPFYYMIWIEGVDDLFTRYKMPNNTISINRALQKQHLFCFFKDGQLIYNNTLFQLTVNDCNKLLSLNNVESIEQITIYPNPAKDRIFVEGIPSGEQATLKIYDMLGRLQVDEVLFSNAHSIAQLPVGLYVVVVQNAQGVLFYRTQLRVE